MAAVGRRGTVKEFAGFNPQEDAEKLRKAMKGFGTDEDAIIDVLAKRTIAQRQRIKQDFKTAFGKDLISDLKSEISGKFEQVVLGLLKTSVLYDVHELKNAIKVWYYCGYSLLRRSKSPSKSSVKYTFSNSFEDLLQSWNIVWTGMVNDTSCQIFVFLGILQEMTCWVLEAEGAGTDDDALIRTMVSRCEIDMLDIKVEFQRLYGKSLHSFIKGDCSGDYKKILLQLCGGE
ncbi:annexin A4-like [Leucoraja erinacea]|uniref:annexin A4-like n=1 Tax=Leucoraja erinaceus TaxID=7782 RepID=UPI0024564E02|nr:annexin A4-like [Leucoraja erinacea]